MKNLTFLTTTLAVSLFTGCASRRVSNSNYPTNSGALIYEKTAPRANAGMPQGSAQRYPQNSGTLVYEKTAPRSNTAVPQESAPRNAVGVWTGSNGEERITLKFGVNGNLILTNAAGAESGRWSGSRNSYRISVGEFSGEFVLLDGSTASFTLGGSHIEMRRTGG